ncbi:hypothetical protein JL107_08445 [Nakamurella flavida]|uniref:Uncharacterized protein n=1 Tax=Nakamurella flavida TaxID=363630 RepID=A0A938YIB3_9ACTN|nr:DUF5691 domain-containing protein [Nakamurella flavida]MBM9476467.1 hypothetical protein [Nakamurella flavida]MDP9779432.1 hypothetical protein [Nakamurella flavida]
MTTRTDLVTAATVGTAHRSVDLAALPVDLRPDPLPAEPAFALLDAAALSALAARTLPPVAAASKAPTVLSVLPAADDRPVVPTVVAQVVDRVTGQAPLLVEAFTLIDRAGLRLPPELVPGLLDDRRPEVVAATRPVAGSIGRLLMSKNPRWAPPQQPDPRDRTVWEHGTLAERTAWLRALRRIDPDEAREVLAAGLSRESAAHRAELLAVLRERLGPADEIFLMTAVGDRSRAVVTAALDLLTLLPASQLRGDLEAVAARTVRIHRLLLRTVVTVETPAAGDLAGWPLGEADLAGAVFARIDPAEWTRLLGGDVLALITRRTEELRPLRPAFRRAALTFRHPGLADALLTASAEGRDPRLAPVIDAELWSLLAPADAAGQLDRLLRSPQVRPDQVAVAAAALPLPWTFAAITRLTAWLPTGGASGVPAPRGLWELWATATAPADCRAVAEIARGMIATATGDQAPTLTTRASVALNLLTLRSVLHEALAPALNETPPDPSATRGAR